MSGVWYKVKAEVRFFSRYYQGSLGLVWMAGCWYYQCGYQSEIRCLQFSFEEGLFFLLGGGLC